LIPCRFPSFQQDATAFDQPSDASRVSHRSTNSWSDPRELRLLQVPSAKRYLRFALSLSGGRKKSLRDNTIILFTSNNGGATSGLFAQGAKSKEEREHEESGIVQILKNHKAKA
jgi:hypothetical protein